MELLKEVLIKECGAGYHDRVFIVENLPKKFLYEKTAKMVSQKDKEGFHTGSLVPSPAGEMVDTLYPGLEESQTGDKGIVFWTTNAESVRRLKEIDRYIEGVFPRDARLEERVDNATQKGSPNASPLPYHLIPRLTLPIPSGASTPASPQAASPAVVPEQAPASMPADIAAKLKRLEELESKETAAKERMAKARAARS
jgi:hypothetical protein